MNPLRNRWAIAFLALLFMALLFDGFQWRAKSMQQAVGQLYLYSYPARKLYARYIQPALGEGYQYPLNRLRVLEEPAGILQQSRSGVYAMALLDMRAGSMPLVFPDNPLFEKASFSVVSWDGLIALGGEAQGAYTVSAGDFDSVFLFVRLPLDPASTDAGAVNAVLDAVHIGSSNLDYHDFNAVNCPLPAPQHAWLNCMDTLFTAIHATGLFANTLTGYRNQANLGDGDDWGRLVRASREADKILAMALRHNVGSLSGNRWWVYRDFFRLDASVLDPLLTRAAFWAAPFLPIPDSKMKVAVNMDDDTGQYLIGGDTVYKLVFDAGQLSPETIDWSFSVYERDNPRVWVTEKPAVLRKDDAVLAADGSLTLYFSQQRPAAVDDASWLPIPAGQFMVVYRAHTRLPLDRYDDFAALSRLERLPLAAE